MANVKPWKGGRGTKGRIGWIVFWVGLLAPPSGPLSAQERWVYRYNGPGNGPDAAYSVVMGRDSNLYAAGCSAGSQTYYDFTVISLTRFGKERWVYRYNGSSDHWDEAYAVAVGLDGNVYATGVSHESGTQYDFLVVSLTPFGEERWVYRYDGPENWFDEAHSIAVGRDGNLYVGGKSASVPLYDLVVISLTPSGTERWVYRCDADLCGEARSISTGADGNLYIAGGCRYGGDLTVISLAPSGEERWVYHHDAPEHHLDWANSIVMGRDGNVYATGGGQGQYYDVIVVSLTRSGTLRWDYRYAGPEYSYDVGNSIVMGSEGNLYVAGESGWNFAVLSVAPLGAERWVYSYGEPTVGWGAAANSIAAGADGNLYVAGFTSRRYASKDFSVVSLTRLGWERWVYRYNGPGNGWDEAYSIVAGLDGNLYAAGCSEGTETGTDFTIISLTPDAGAAEYKLEVLASPIPAVGDVKVCYSLQRDARVSLSVYDVCGRLIRKLVDATERGGPKAIFWDCENSYHRKVASGTYFIRLEAGGLCACRKVIVLR